MKELHVLPRLLAARFPRAARAVPVVVLTGARQTGKTTMARSLGSDRAYATLDDLDLLDLAIRDPRAFLRSFPGRATFDEVQRAPHLLMAVKAEVDRKRERGRFLITGSANLLLLRSVRESLAGRAAFLTLWPMTRSEREGRGGCGAWSDLLGAEPREWPAILDRRDGRPAEWRTEARRGGFPVPALELGDPRDRAEWFAGYVRSCLERDLLPAGGLPAVLDLHRLLRACAHRTGAILNQADLARDIGLSPATVHRHLDLLEASYLIVRLPAFSTSPSRRLAKAPRLFGLDVGLSLHLAREESPAGSHIEHLVLGDLLAWRDAEAAGRSLHYWRTAAGAEVDFVAADGDRLLPVEVKATRSPRHDDGASLALFLGDHPRRARAGLLLHGGEGTAWIRENVLATPWWRVL